MPHSVTFSVIIPTLDRPAKLTRCLEALAGQDIGRDRFEVLVVDDGGSARLDAILHPFADRLNVSLIRQPNAGPGAARNTGAAHARGRFLAFTDDDCRPASDWLTALASALEREPDALIGGRTVNELTDNLFASASQLIVDLVYAHYNRDASRPRFFASNNFVLPAGRFTEVGGFDPLYRVGAEDRDLCHRWLQRGLPTAFDARAVVRHAHDLTLGGYCRQHFNYGRGATTFHAECGRRGTGRLRDHVGFHARLPRLLLDQLDGVLLTRVAALCGLLIVWQIANAAGFLSQLAA